MRVPPGSTAIASPPPLSGQPVIGGEHVRCSTGGRARRFGSPRVDAGEMRQPVQLFIDDRGDAGRRVMLDGFGIDIGLARRRLAIGLRQRRHPHILHPDQPATALDRCQHQPVAGIGDRDHPVAAGGAQPRDAAEARAGARQLHRAGKAQRTDADHPRIIGVERQRFGGDGDRPGRGNCGRGFGPQRIGAGKACRNQDGRGKNSFEPHAACLAVSSRYR